MSHKKNTRKNNCLDLLLLVGNHERRRVANEIWTRITITIEFDFVLKIYYIIVFTSARLMMEFENHSVVVASGSNNTCEHSFEQKKNEYHSTMINWGSVVSILTPIIPTIQPMLKCFINPWPLHCTERDNTVWAGVSSWILKQKNIYWSSTFGIEPDIHHVLVRAQFFVRQSIIAYVSE